MSKIDWSKDKREPDPARAQQINDFVEPDATIISVTEVKHSEEYKYAALLQRLRANGQARRKARAAEAKAAKNAARQRLLKR